MVVLAKKGGVNRYFIAHHWDERHGLGTGGNHHIGFAGTDAVSRNLHGVNTRGAVAVDGHTADGHRQPCQQRANPRHVQALLAFGEGTARHHVIHQMDIKARDLCQSTANHMSQHVVWAGVAQHATGGFADRCAGCGNNIGFLHLLGHGAFSSHRIGSVVLPVLGRAGGLRRG